MQEIRCFSIFKGYSVNGFFREMINIYFENPHKHVNTLRGQNLERLNVKSLPHASQGSQDIVKMSVGFRVLFKT